MKITNIVCSVAALAACIIATESFAQAQTAGNVVEVESAGAGTAMDFAAGTLDPVALSKAYANVASSSSIAWSALTNSAAIPFASQRFDVSAGYQMWAPNGVKSNNFGLGAAFNIKKKFGISLALGMNAGEKYTQLDAGQNVMGDFTPKDIYAALGLGFKCTSFLSAGVNLKYLSQSVSEDDSYSAFAADVHVMGKFSDFNVVLGVNNLGTSVKAYDGEKFSLPTSVVAAGGYSHAFGRHGLHNVAANLDLNYYFSGDFTAALGLEYGFKNMAFVRAGYHYGDASAVIPSFASVGLGVKLIGIKLDVAYLLANEFIGNSVAVGLAYSF